MTAYSTLGERFRYVQQYGSHSMSYSTLQPGLCYFTSPGIGYIAYAEVRSMLTLGRQIAVVLADPVAHTSALGHLIREFLSFRNDTLRSAVTIFVQASHLCAKELSWLGLKVNQMGVETELAIKTFDLYGKRKAALRQWLNKARREGVTVCECELSDMCETDLDTMSRDWLLRKGGRELSFLTRPFVPGAEEGVRYFCATQGDRIVGFASFDPLYHGGSVFGYYLNHLRYLRSAPRGTTDLLTLDSLKTFCADGCSLLSLGMSPCAGLGQEYFDHNKLSAWALRFMYRRCGFVYPFRGNEFHKAKYGGRSKPVYFASTRGTTLLDIVAVLKACRIL